MSSVRKYPSGKKLIPEGDDKAYGRFEQACSIEQSYFAAAAEAIGTELVIRPCVYSCLFADMLLFLLYIS